MKWIDNHADVYTANIQRLETSELTRDVETSNYRTSIEYGSVCRLTWTCTYAGDGSNEAAMNVEERRRSWFEIQMGLLRLQPLNWSVS